MQGISEMEESAFMEPASGVGIAPLQHINRKNESCRESTGFEAQERSH